MHWQSQIFNRLSVQIFHQKWHQSGLISLIVRGLIGWRFDGVASFAATNNRIQPVLAVIQRSVIKKSNCCRVIHLNRKTRWISSSLLPEKCMKKTERTNFAPPTRSAILLLIKSPSLAFFTSERDFKLQLWKLRRSSLFNTAKLGCFWLWHQNYTRTIKSKKTKIIVPVT